jgi:hypothetical protein
MAQEKNFVRGSAREVVFANGSNLYNFSLNILDENMLKEAGIPADLAKLCIAARKKDEARTKEERKGTGWCQLVLSKKKAVDQFHNTHYTYVNEFKPDAAKAKPKQVEPEKDDEELPF